MRGHGGQAIMASLHRAIERGNGWRVAAGVQAVDPTHQRCIRKLSPRYRWLRIRVLIASFVVRVVVLGNGKSLCCRAQAGRLRVIEEVGETVFQGGDVRSTHGPGHVDHEIHVQRNGFGLQRQFRARRIRIDFPISREARVENDHVFPTINRIGSARAACSSLPRRPARAAFMGPRSGPEIRASAIGTTARDHGDAKHRECTEQPTHVTTNDTHIVSPETKCAMDER